MIEPLRYEPIHGSMESKPRGQWVRESDYERAILQMEELEAWQQKALGLMDHYDITRPEHDDTCSLRVDRDYNCDCYAEEQAKEFGSLIEEAGT